MHTIESVFPTLKLPPDLQAEAANLLVEKVAATPERDTVFVYLFGEAVPKEEVLARLREALQKELYGKKRGRVVFKERYRLGKDLSPQAIWKAYQKNILIRLKEKDRLLFEVVNAARISFPEEGTIKAALMPGALSECKENEVSRFFGKLFSEHFGKDVSVHVSYQNPPKTKEEQKKNEALSGEIEAAMKKLSAAKAAQEKEEATNKAPSRIQKEKSGGKRKDPSLIFGKGFTGDPVPLNELSEEAGDVTVRGEVIAFEEMLTKNQKTMMRFVLTDNTDSIRVKLFLFDESKKEFLREALSPGSLIMLCGFADVDTFEKEYIISRVKGIKRIEEFRESRVDTAKEKRIELHCHTKMSDMDAIASPEDIVNGAVKMGHTAVAITDHGVVHGFPEAHKALKTLQKKAPDTVPEGFKILYGMEGYLVDDAIDLVTNETGQDFSASFVAFDLETTGFHAKEDAIIEIGAVKIEKGKITDRFSSFVNPKRPIPAKITELTGIDKSMVQDAPPAEAVVPAFLSFIKGAVLVAHNASFDVGFIRENAARLSLPFSPTVVDTLSLARVFLPELNRYKLDTVAKKLNVPLAHHHRAVDDAVCAGEIFLKLIPLMKEKGISTLAALSQVKITAEVIKKLKTYHVILLAKNEEGRKNLYRLVSASHLEYFARRPRLPKSLVAKMRNGLLIGSACVAGELFDALLNEKSEEALQKIIAFYDYLEVQPLGNNRFLFADGKHSNIRTDADLIALNQKVIALGEKYKKPVVATGDVHFFAPEDEICRRIIQAGNGYKDADRDDPLYFRTTGEMLNEFSYLPAEKAREIVITNPQKIAGQIEAISPVRSDKCPPVIPHSDETLKDMVYEKAHAIYGETLPAPVGERLQRELTSIIQNGYAVLYIIAQKLVKKSNDDGYLVGSRGSVGSSLVAFMAGITEVNSLKAHYFCPKCHFSDFDSQEVSAYENACGLDMPQKPCPVCGSPLKRDGWNIPFETFLGFKGDKEPDIDLNFSGDYQGKAHRYTEVIFGKGHTFKAGTISTVADKTTYGYVRHYFEDRGIRKRKCEINRMVERCKGVRKSTGQHPGGIIVLPHGEEIHTFTPIQHPANDTKTDIITTHFDYHSIDSNLLKLDILGHDDPTMVRRLEDLTGLSVEEMPLDDEKVFSLFHDTKALGISPQDIHGCELGCLGVPEFGTDFVIQIVKEARPKTFADLIRISGLSHGTNVWLDNAKDLIADGVCELSGAICTRDDIMTYLISTGMDKSLSFTIMEAVRKGKGLTADWEDAMRKANVPDWYIESCKRISYMFPKAHAVAYVIMALRIAYCKVYYPLAYYAAYFAIRASAFSYEVICRGKDVLQDMFDKLEHTENLSPKDEAMLKDMRIAEEMYARGFSFLPLDIYKAKPKDFQIMDGKIMPSLMSIEGMGEKAAQSLYESAKEAPFLSKEDLKNRAHLSKNIVDAMSKLHLLGDLPQTDQLSLFDML